MNFQEVPLRELRSYLVNHRDDEQAFHTYVEGRMADLASPEALRNLAERAKAKRLSMEVE